MHYFWLLALLSTFFQIFRCSLSFSLNLKLCSEQYNKKFVLHLIVASHLSSGHQHNYSTKTRQAGQANEQSMYPLMYMVFIHVCMDKGGGL